MDIELIISKGLLYSILTAVMTAVYLTTVYLSEKFLAVFMGYSYLWVTIPTLFILAIAFQPLKDKVQNKVDQLVYPEKQKFRKTIKYISDSLSTKININQIFKLVSETLENELGLNNVQIVIGGKKKAVENKPQLSLPVKYEGKIIGYLELGEKRSRDSYTEEDKDLLGALCGSIAVAIENASLHEKALKAQEELLLADKFSSLGRVAAGIAHEIRNPLAAMKGMTQSIGKNIKNEEFLNDLKEVLPTEIDKLNLLVTELMELGKPKTTQYEEMDLNELIEKDVKLYDRYCETNKIIMTKELGKIRKISGNWQQLSQVLTNLVMNAFMAMPEGGNLRIITRENEGKVVLEIEDTGEGIDKEVLSHIFEPFFTTKAKGLGLGLATVYKIIKEHGGEIEVESESGKGTRFEICLPGLAGND
jgi:signal transduction histidine kinase